ncbi:hypothetical protein J4401_05010 [Candidatus Woesearchaeota archaeon]|nr:hypothetical protein [Candidatus Woesearchaeota archaeon]
MGTEAHIPEKYFHGFNKPLNLQDNLQYILLSDEVDREKVVGRYKSSAEVGSPLRVGDRCIVDVLAPNPAERVVDVENSIQVLFPKIIGVHEFCGLEGSIEDDPAGGLKQARHIVQQYMDLRTNLVDRAIESHRNFVKAAITYATLIEPE